MSCHNFLTPMQRVFALAQTYVEPDPLDETVRWPVPRDTWLQRRRRELAMKEEGGDNA